MADPTLRQLRTLAPLAQRYAVAVVDTLREMGLPAVIVEGRRSRRRQAQLYAIGRSLPGRKVTQTMASRHLAGTAFDIAWLDDRDVVRWDAPDDWWEQVGYVAESYGLRWGGRFSGLADQPHVELP